MSDNTLEIKQTELVRIFLEHETFGCAIEFDKSEKIVYIHLEDKADEERCFTIEYDVDDFLGFLDGNDVDYQFDDLNETNEWEESLSGFYLTQAEMIYVKAVIEQEK